MGCASSKHDELPAVALCHERCSFLDDAIHHRYALSEAHLAYTHSLKAVGLSLHRFFDQNLDNSMAVPPSPDPLPDSSLHHQSENSSPLHSYVHHHVNYPDQDAQNSYPGGGFMNMNFNYMKNNPTTSVTYQQRPMSPETLNMGESSSSYYSSYPFVNENPNSYPNSTNGYPPGTYGGGFSGFSGPPNPPPPPVGPVAEANSEASSSKPPHPPPSPPSSSTWDFLYPFQSFENYYLPTRPFAIRRNEDFQHEVVKEVHGDQKFVDGGGKIMRRGGDGAAGWEGGKWLGFTIRFKAESFNRKRSVSSKMLHVITPSSQPSTSTTTQSSSIEIDEDVGMSSSNLSSTLQKLYLWEKKLYEEVKVLHERKCSKLKHLDERGAEAHKIDATRTLVRSLSTKIRIAIQVVDKISVKINKLRDEELLPQLNEFIQGLTRMWKAMLECHRSQCQAMGQANGAPPVLDSAISGHKHWMEFLRKKWLILCEIFATCVLQLWKQDKLDMHQRMMVNNRDMERKVKNLEREDQKMQKEIQALEKRIVQVSGDSNGLSIGGHVYQSDTSKTNNLQVSLQHIFEAMEKFTAKSLEAYEELLQRIEDDKLAQEKERVS
ncbi:Nitrate regulatory gene2 protein [Camellia lanceoleosa]|uniref:Nitrate regulatory gene2 protein n=1 Tax=Camellia lanceoleosa TaxID=1840588 RepID=A0ACC0IHX9_9ERIC|nr:Nitrate regulatory gene2 protein [Camellia lanceoleosa]